MESARWKIGLLAVVLAAMAAPHVVHAQSGFEATVGAAVEGLRALGSERAGPWHFQLPASAGGEMPDVDDTAWPLVWPEHSWAGDNQAAWYRRTVVIPEKLGAAPNPGGPLVLEVGCDDAGEIYVNGKLVQKFAWDKGQAVITDDAKPGQTFVIAVKCINNGGPGRLLSASMRYTKLDPVRDQIINMAETLESAMQLLQMGDEMPEGAAESLRKAATTIDFTALGDPARFAASMDAAQQALEPFAVVAKKYTTYLIGHAHIDMNWLWLWPETVQVCHDTWWQAIKFTKEFPEFEFSESQCGAYIAVEEKYPDLFAEMKQAIKDGRWEITAATWVQGDTNMASGEALARQFLTSREYCMDRFGKWTKTLWLPDNFGHAATVPTIAHDAGIEYFYFARCGPGYPMFQWEGPDGSRIVGYNYGGYGWNIDQNAVRSAYDLRRQQGLHEAMVVYGVGDHGGGPTRHDIESAISLRKNPLAPQVKFARTDEFFPAALKEKVELPVVRHELNFTFRGCYTTHSDIKRENRRLENFLPTAEAAASAANVLTGRKYDGFAFTQAWRSVLFNQFHDIFCGSAIHDSYKYSAEINAAADAAARKELDGSVAALAQKIDTRGNGDAYLLWNRLGWPRAWTQEVDAPITGPATQSVDMPSAAGQSRVTMIRASVPACGWSVVHATDEGLKPGDTVKLADAPDAVTMENSRLRVVVDRKTGALRSVYDKVQAKELVPSGQQADVPQILWEDPHGMSAWEIGNYSSIKPILEADSVQVAAQGPLAAGVIVKHHYEKSTLTQWIGLRASEAQVDFRLVVDWQQKGTAQLGGPMLKMAFPMNLTDPSFTCDVPFGSVERSRDGQDVPGQMWSDLTEMKSLTAPGKPTPVDLTAYFNLDAIATDNQPDDGDMDGGHMSYPAAIFEGAKGGLMTWNDIPWRAGPTGPGEKNAVRCIGQTIPMPQSPADGIVFFGASAAGESGGMGSLVFTDGSKEPLPISYSDWCFGPGSGEEIAARATYRLIPSGKTVPECRIFARSYELPKGKRLKAVILPRAERMKIFAITLGPRRMEQPVWGAALLNNCKYGYDAAGSTLRLTIVRSSYDPDPEPDLGVQEIRYALVPHAGSWGDDVVRRAWELNNPLIVAAAASHQGTLPAAGSLVSLDPANLVLAAVKKAEHGAGLIVRWYETRGLETTAKLHFGFDVASALRTNVTEADNRGALPVKGRDVTAKTPAHGVVTVRVVPAAVR